MMRSAIEALAVAVLAAVLGYGATYATKHYVPLLWFVWLGSGAAISFGLSWWKPRYWGVAAAATPSLVLIETISKLGDAPPTAAALGLGFAAFWALTSCVGAWFGRTLAPRSRLPGAPEAAGLAWQIGVWDRMSDVYLREIDRRFAPVVEQVITRARLSPGERVLDLGTGTGAVAERAAQLVDPEGLVVGVDISPDMLRVAHQRMAARGLTQVSLREGRAEVVPAENEAFDVVLASLSLMYVIDRAAAARELARVLRPRGRLIAAVWAEPEACDIVLFQQTAGRFAGPPPVPGVGPGALADATPFLKQLAEAGIEALVERETLGFDFESFGAAWNTLAGVTTAHLPPQRQQEAQAAVMAAMYPRGDAPRHFRNTTQFIVGRRRG
jgi:SAM-dependent methyltransferase